MPGSYMGFLFRLLFVCANSLPNLQSSSEMRMRERLCETGYCEFALLSDVTLCVWIKLSIMYI